MSDFGCGKFGRRLYALYYLLSEKTTHTRAHAPREREREHTPRRTHGGGGGGGRGGSVFFRSQKSCWILREGERERKRCVLYNIVPISFLTADSSPGKGERERVEKCRQNRHEWGTRGECGRGDADVVASVHKKPPQTLHGSSFQRAFRASRRSDRLRD